MKKQLQQLLAFITSLILAVLPAAGALAFGIQPPWTPPLVDGVNITVPGVNNVPDLRGDINNPQLVIFFAGNQYMVVNRLLEAFERAHPEYSPVFAATLPPGLLAESIENGGFVIGNMLVSAKPDIFTAGRGRIKELQTEHQWFAETADYARNRLAIMTYLGNPYGINNWEDLARPGLKICMPNPEWEGIASNVIIPVLEKTGGKALVQQIYQLKVANGGTFLTRIHHRQTPARIMKHKCAAGAVWYTEAYFHADIARHPIAVVALPEADNKIATYTAGLMRNAPHPEAAKAFLQFLTGPEGQAIYRKYGFMSPQ